MQCGPKLVWASIILAACGGEPEPANRDLSLAPAESTQARNDQPAATDSQPASQAAPVTQQPPRQSEPARPPRQQPPREEPRPTPPAVATLPAGTVLELGAADTLTSRHNLEGDTVRAIVLFAVRDADGREIIPAGAQVTGTIVDLAPAGSPGGEGRMVINYDRVRFGGNTYALVAGVDTMETFTKGRGISAGDAAKVGVGAAVGAIAGRVIGGNSRGTAVGAVVGAAAGAGIMAATRDEDIILPAGALVRLVLVEEFRLEPLAT